MVITQEVKIKGKILHILRSNARGMTVTEISKEIELNRNSTAKYLDILTVGGQIDLRPTGRAKLFYISQRVPISALLDFSTDYILVLDSGTRIVEVNDNFQRLFKVKKELLLDVKLQSANLPIFNRKESMKKIRDAIKGKDSTFEMKIAFDMMDLYFKGKLIPSALGDGTNGVTIIMENITEQKEAESKLKRSEERYRELIQNQGEGLALTDEFDTFTFANPAAEILMGVGPGKLVGRNVHDFVSPAESKKIMMQSERRKKGRKDTYQMNIISEDKKRKAILLTVSPRFDNNGKFCGTQGVFMDITMMKENQKRTMEGELKYRTLFESSSDGILILKENKIMECNESVVRMFEFDSKNDLIGMNPSNLSPEFQDDGTPSDIAVIEKMKEAAEKGKVDMIWNHVTKNGRPFLAEVKIQSIDLEEGPFFQATLRDITDVVETHRQLVKKQARLDNILSSLHESFIGLLDRDLNFTEFWGTEELNEKYQTDWRLVRGMSILAFTPERSREYLKKGIGNIFKDGKPFRMENETIFPGGKFWQEWSFSPFRNSEGDIEYIILFGHDIHEKHVTFESLMEFRNRCHLLDNNVSDVIWMTDRKLKFTYVSSSIKDLLGYSVKEIKKMSIMDTLTSESMTSSRGLFDERLRILNGSDSIDIPPITVELQQLTKTGVKKRTEVSVSILSDEDGKPSGLTGVTREIGQRR